MSNRVRGRHRRREPGGFRYDGNAPRMLVCWGCREPIVAGSDEARNATQQLQIALQREQLVSAAFWHDRCADHVPEWLRRWDPSDGAVGIYVPVVAERFDFTFVGRIHFTGED